MYDRTVRERAAQLRAAGKTYAQIVDAIGVPKSTLSLWLRALPLPPNSTPKAKRAYFLKHVQRRGAAANHAKRLTQLEEVKRAAKDLVKRHRIDDDALALAILASLYWAEGSKNDRNGMTFANTDPALAYLFITLLRRSFPIEEQRLRIRLHIHHYHDQEYVEQYWSTLLQVPRGQFQKTFVKPRHDPKRFRRNFAGICFIRYGDNQILRSVLAYASALQEHLAPIAQGIERVPAEDEVGGSNPPGRATQLIRI